MGVSLPLGAESRRGRFVVSQRPDFTVGDGSYINGLTVYCWDGRVHVDICRYCSLGDSIVMIAGGEHDKDWVPTYPFIDRWGLAELAYKKRPRFKGDIRLGHDVWVGNNVLILSGVAVGHGAVIGAGSVVTRDVPPYAVAAGNPAQVLYKRFAEETIEALLRIAWWDWPKSTLVERLIHLDNVEEFIASAREIREDGTRVRRSDYNS